MRPILPALLAAALVACQPGGQDSETPPAVDTAGRSPGGAGLCEADAIPIAEVQGSGFSSPLSGEIIVVRGVVTHFEADGGLFIQDPDPFSTREASHGLYVAPPGPAIGAARGDLLALKGLVGEIGQREDTITAFVEVSAGVNCGPGREPPVFDARLPLTAHEREAFEGMRVLMEQPLTVTDADDVSEGRITVSALGVLRAPTEVASPGAAALALERKNRDWSLPLSDSGLRTLDPYTKIHVGALINAASGVIGHDGRQLCLITDGDLAFVAQPPAEVPRAGDGIVRVASFNLHEYFNGDGRGGGFPGERGPRSAREFDSQAARVLAAVAEIRPDVLAVQELENDGFGPYSAVRELARTLSEALGVSFAVAEPESARVGTDVISVGMVYRPDRLEALGAARLLEGGTFGTLNRVPLAQLFGDRRSGERLLLVVNHLKSKSFCPDSGPDSDQGDGQACWNPTRVEGAHETVRWARQLAAAAGTENVLLVGDFNAYRKEDPVLAITGEGLSELVAEHQPGIPQYSYVYRGAAGSLDYAFAGPPLAGLSSDAFIWHINAAYPWSGRPSKPWLHSSDHDPLVVDLRFSQPATSD